MSERHTTVEAVIAVDWSGALTGERRKLWMCEVRDGRVTRLEDGRTRDELADAVIAIGYTTPAVVAGFDFGFSLPEWFLRERELVDAHALWALAASDVGTEWITKPVAPFWRHGGAQSTGGLASTRATEDATGDVVGRRPSSVFKLVGAGQVGVGSIRGMPTLTKLSAHGWAVWPFDDQRPGQPTAVEIWPRALYHDAKVTKSSVAEREKYLARYEPNVPTQFRDLAIGKKDKEDDAFDALTAALAMWRGRASLAQLPPARDATERLEGRIWTADLPAATTPETTAT